MADQFNLFGAEPHAARAPETALPGLRQAPRFIEVEEQHALIAHINAERLEPFKFQQWEGKRLTASFGWTNDFNIGKAAPAPPFPEWLLPIRHRAAAFAGLQPENLVQALLIRYDPGAGIGWHRDRPMFEHVIGISLGHSAAMRFRRRRPGGFDRARVELAPRSIYHLSAEARHCWEHSIAPMDVPRWSITLRSLTKNKSAACSLRISHKKESTMAELSEEQRDHLDKASFAFPEKRKMPLENARHVRNAVARFNQVKGVSDHERDAAWKKIKAAAKRHDVTLSEKDWRDIGKG